MKRLYEGNISIDTTMRTKDGDDIPVVIKFYNAIIEINTEGIIVNRMKYTDIIKTITINEWEKAEEIYNKEEH